jgi:hypothetical protein
MTEDYSIKETKINYIINSQTQLIFLWHEPSYIHVSTFKKPSTGCVEERRKIKPYVSK